LTQRHRRHSIDRPSSASTTDPQAFAVSTASASPTPAPMFDRLLLTGAAGNLGRVLRPRLKRAADVLRVSDIADLGPPGPGEELMPAPLQDKAAVMALLQACRRWCTWAACPPSRPSRTSSTPTSWAPAPCLRGGTRAWHPAHRLRQLEPCHRLLPARPGHQPA
jgi:hypothetical protein